MTLKNISSKLQKILSKEILTVGEVAKILQLAPRTIQRMCDCGTLPCFRLKTSLNQPGDRRVFKSDLVKMLKQQPGMSRYVEMVEGLFHVLTLGVDKLEEPNIIFHQGFNTFDCGKIFASNPISFILADFNNFGRTAAIEIFRSARRDVYEIECAAINTEDAIPLMDTYLEKYVMLLPSGTNSINVIKDWIKKKEKENEENLQKWKRTS